MKDLRPVEIDVSAFGEELTEADWESATPAMRQLVARLASELARLQETVAELEDKLRTNSSNSSKPPSSDGPGVDRERRRREGKGKRKRGGQPGHEGKSRKLVDVSKVNFVHVVQPGRCACGGALCIDAERVERHQVWELPPFKPTVTEYRLHQGQCTRCGQWTQPQLPPEAQGGMLGPRAMAVVALLTGKFRLSRRAAQELARDLLGLDVSLGTISNTEARVSDALRAPYDEAFQAVAGQSVVHMDETSWREDKKRVWLWTAVTSLFTVFAIRSTRASRVAKELLGQSFGNVLVTDRWSAYNWLATSLRQLCWAHLIRDFTKISERGGESELVGEALLDQAKDVFLLWHRFRGGELSRDQLQQKIEPIRLGLRMLLEAGAELTDERDKKTRGTCAEILKLEDAMWRFVFVEGVQPTNNAAERSIRHAVIWRKTSFGTDSPRGSRYVERVLTVVATCRQQGRNALDFLCAAVEAHYSDAAAPSLLHLHEATDATLPLAA